MPDKPVSRLTRNPVSTIGAGITTVSALLFVVAFLADLVGIQGNPYMGIVFFLVLPGMFVCGLLLIPLGMVFEHRRRLREGFDTPRVWPRLDFNAQRMRTIGFTVAVLTVVNGVVVALAAYRGVEYMDSVPFCGQLCHTVMEPEFVAYQDGPHSRVACVQCHIGPGAPWFVKSKLSGLRQVYAVTFHTYSRPIPTPVTSLRPARDTCEQCHWPAQFHGDIVNVIREYASDEKNTETATTLQLHVGSGGTGPAGPTGIHWHVNPGNRIEFVATDDRREVIAYVKLTDANGSVREYMTPGVSAGDLAKYETRTMDCIDCHNRPTHAFAPSAERALDHAIGFGEVPRSLPFIRREAVALLKVAYPSRSAATEAIRTKLEQFYGTDYPEVYASRRAELDRAIHGIDGVYRKNVFPAMRVTWGTHPNNIGHADSPGCFRCHDDNHKSADGRTIQQDCDLCHTFE
jgi:nitrate/TMAO reductase-like tetraheme cytochrome c subunit